MIFGNWQVIDTQTHKTKGCFVLLCFYFLEGLQLGASLLLCWKEGKPFLFSGLTI
jgi:hypothetical protein